MSKLADYVQRFRSAPPLPKEQRQAHPSRWCKLRPSSELHGHLTPSPCAGVRSLRRTFGGCRPPAPPSRSGRGDCLPGARSSLPADLRV